MSQTPFVAGLTGAALIVIAAGPVPVAPPPRPADPVPALIRDLGSPDYATRERASARLAGLDVGNLPPALLEAVNSPDPEVRRRAAAAVQAIRARGGPGTLAAAARFGAAGAVDRLVATSAAWAGPPNDPRTWKVVRTLVEQLGVQSGAGRDRYTSFTDEAQFGDRVRMTFVRADRPYRPPEVGEAIRNRGVVAPGAESPTGISYSTVVARGPVAARSVVQRSVVLASGNVTVGLTCFDGTVVVADGDVDIGQNADQCLVVARGDIRVKAVAMQCVLVAGGRVTVGRRFETPEKPDLAPVVVENERNPFGFVTWWELSAAGVEAGKADGGVAVTKAAPGWPFAAAGVRKGDVVTRVGDHPVAAPDDLRRRLRDAHAAAAEAVVHLRRGGQDLTVRVPLPH